MLNKHTKRRIRENKARRIACRNKEQRENHRELKLLITNTAHQTAQQVVQCLREGKAFGLESMRFLA